MDLRVLKYFITVVKEGNISKAAQVLHVTQPTLSRQLISLEQDLGTKLFIRGKREITLTQDGVLFLQRAQEIIELTDKVKKEFSQRKDLVEGNISIGCVETKGSKSLAGFISQFHEKYPKVTFEIFNGDSDMILYKLDKGLLDVGCLVQPVDYSNHDYLYLPGKDKWGVLVRQDDPLSLKKSITLTELRNKPLGIPKRNLLYNTILDWFEEDKELNIVTRYTMLSNLIYLVENRMLYGITIEGAIGTRGSDSIVFVPIEPEITTESVLVWKKDRLWSGASRTFIDEAQNYFKETDNRNE